MKFALILLTLLAAIAVRPQLPNEIAFAGDDRVYVIRADGTGQRAITSQAIGTERPRWSRDGRQIVFTKGDVQYLSPSIWKMHANGSNQTFVLNEVSADGLIPSQPVFSPNGDRIAYVGCECFFDGDAILIANADGSNSIWVTGWHISTNGLDWSPVGERLVYSEVVNFGPTQFYRISSIDTNGTDGLVLTALGQGSNFDPVWSPDGSKIAFVSDRDGNSEIYTMNSDGTHQGRITYSTADDRDPAWSPDGTRLAFSSNRNGPYNIYVVNDDGTNEFQVTQNAFNSRSPHWNPRGGFRRAAFDFDGDGRSDVSVFRRSDSVWYLNRSAQGLSQIQFGLPTDDLVPADFDGDGKTEIAVFRDGVWWLRNSANETISAVQFGQTGDVPVPADYTGDGRDELAVFRDGEWWTVDLSNAQSSLVNFGLSTDKPVPADYDGDGKTDIAIFRPSDGSWWIHRSSGGVAVVSFGIAGDAAVPRDYTGDGKTDIAVWRPSDGNWYVLRSEDSSYFAFPWGLPTDTPVPGDYDGDGKTDAAVFRSGTWYINRTTGAPLITAFGLVVDQPIPNAYVPVIDN
ncbi:MAG TPA: FG-GAP-like repeat-containing protein [Pyrinomonadaceae bacterium]|nr:FG-GAP-like repeat-containing protein [Pyrinomonadaceae bacterium]